MAVIKTRLQVLNDTAEALAEKASAVPLKGEIVYDQTNRKMKMCDGTTALGDLKFVGGDEAKHFDVMANVGEEDVAAITRVVAGAEIHTGDTAIVKRTIINDKIFKFYLFTPINIMYIGEFFPCRASITDF